MMPLETLQGKWRCLSVWPLLRHNRTGTIHGMAEHQSHEDATYLRWTEPSQRVFGNGTCRRSAPADDNSLGYNDASLEIKITKQTGGDPAGTY